MLAIDWKFWKSYIRPSSAKHITIRMLGRIAALRELYSAKLDSYPLSGSSSGELVRQRRSSETKKENNRVVVELECESEQLSQRSSAKITDTGESFRHLNDAADEFFDFPDESEYQTEALLPSDTSMHSQDQRQHKMSSAAVFVKKLHDLAVQRRGHADLQEGSIGDKTHFSYGSTLQKDATCSIPCSWASGDPSTYLIRGETYLQDRQKIKANGTLMQMVAADWLQSDKREDDLGGRPGGIVQKYAAQGGSEFFFIVNFQIPGSTTVSLALYYMMDTPVDKVPCLEKFIRGDDAYRNSRFKLIPYISKGSWIVKQSVGKKACLIGQGLETNYFHGKNYIELDIGVGSSTVASGVAGLVMGYMNNLVVEMAFLIQGNTEEELPEFLLGTCRLNHLDSSKTVSLNS